MVVLTGPRQCGKTMLARVLLSPDSPNYFDLEEPGSLARLEEPMTALDPLTGLVVIDEIQRRPELWHSGNATDSRVPLPRRQALLACRTGGGDSPEGSGR